MKIEEASAGNGGRKGNFRLALMLGLLLASAGARADVIQTFSPDLTIPEGNPAGVINSELFTMGTAGQTVGSISVNLNVNGGFNGDLFAYLVAPNGTLALLMNQPGVAVDGGFGNPQPGMNITLSDAGSSSIQDIPDPLPAEAASPLTGIFSAEDTLGTFGNSPVNGSWSIYFADLGDGGSSPVLESWTMDIGVVPEPVNAALAGFAVLFIVGTMLRPGRIYFRRNRSHFQNFDGNEAGKQN